MKAAVYYKYGSPDVLRLEEIEKPVPGTNEVLIRNYATTVTAVDSIFRKGEAFFARMATGIMKPKNRILGSEFAGEVETVGKNVKKFKPGDKVFGDSSTKGSTHAEYLILREDDPVEIIPELISFEEAASVPYGTLTALPFLRDHGKIKKGDKILIIGASGSVGIYALQFAKIFEADVTAVCSTDNVDLVRSLGADEVIDYRKEDFTRNGKSYDIIFDTVGKSSFRKCKNSLGKGGIFLTTVIGLPILFNMILTSRSEKKAVIAFTGLRKNSEKSEDLTLIKELLQNGRIKSVIDKKYTLDQIKEAHGYVDSGHKKGNVVINIITNN